MSTGPAFTDEQKQYLQGFFAGLISRRGAGSGDPLVVAPPGPVTAPPITAGAPATDIHRAAQDRFLAAGKQLVPEELAKRAKDPFDMWEEMRANVAAARFPKGTDVFLHKFHGLFYVAPAQNAFMCRLRIPNGILTAAQFRGLGEIATKYAGGYADITTRANLQLREILPQHGLDLLMAIQELGLTSRGAGADNIRNITGSPTAGIDPQELIDTRPLCRDLHHTILNRREFYGLPRKFNIAFDGGGQISVLEDTNDIAFAAVRVGEGQPVPAGVYFRVQLGGITGHGDFARDSGLLLKPEECTRAALALVRVFIDHGDRTDRKKARLKYVLERLGLDGFVREAEKHFGIPFRRLPLDACEPRPAQRAHGHIGVHRQRQQGFNYLGVVVPVGRLTARQMAGLADLAERHGGGSLRLTVWQNLLISDVPDADVKALQTGLGDLGLACSTSAIRGALVACTGNAGCKFSATDTKGQALALADYLDPRVALDQPINIHLTGCPHSCAQHRIGDIGLLGAKIEQGDDLIEGYSIWVGGSAGATQRMGREVLGPLPFADVPQQIEGMLRVYLAHRQAPAESFAAFAARHGDDALRRLFAGAAA